MKNPQLIYSQVLSAAAFAMVLSLWLVVILVFWKRLRAQQQKIGLRIGLNQQPNDKGRVLRLWHGGQEATTWVPDLKKQQTYLARLERMRVAAGWKSSLNILLLRVACISVLAFIVTFVATGSALVATCGIVGVMMGFSIILKQAVARRATLFEKQLVEALELAARSLRIGQPLAGSFALIAEEIAAPLGPVFAGICQQQAMGMALDEAVRSVAEQSGSPDMKFFATSVVIQLRSGGSLAEMMERLAFMIRDRMRLARRVRVLTAQTQFSKRVLQVLPFLVFVLLSVINPEYMEPLYTTDGGKMILVMAGAGLLMGTWTMNKLAVIKY